MQTPGKTRISCDIDKADDAAIDADIRARSQARAEQERKSADIYANRIRALLRNAENDTADGPEAQDSRH